MKEVGFDSAVESFNEVCDTLKRDERKTIADLRLAEDRLDIAMRVLR